MGPTIAPEGKATCGAVVVEHRMMWQWRARNRKECRTRGGSCGGRQRRVSFQAPYIFFVEAGSVGSREEQGELVVTAGRVISPGCNACQYRDQVVKGLENMWFLEKHLREA